MIDTLLNRLRRVPSVTVLRVAALAALVGVLAARGFGSSALTRVALASSHRHYELLSLAAELGALALTCVVIAVITRQLEWPRPAARLIALGAALAGALGVLALIVIDAVTLPTLSSPPDAFGRAADRHSVLTSVPYKLAVVLALGLLVWAFALSVTRRPGPVIPALSGLVAAVGLLA